MTELKRIEDNIRSVFADSAYPQDFLDAYDQMECLASRSGRETFLVRNKDTGETAVAKCYDRAVFPFRPNPEFLRDLDCPGLPRFIGRFQNEQMLCVVREYVEGETLSDYVREKQLTRQQILSISCQICDILSVLHHQQPPIVHRDVKPENVIIRPDGTAALIDFDISRSVREDGGSDTVVFGTRGYAPPEQYGFGQTDARADIYSFGVLLRWLVTGSAASNPNIRIDSRLQRVIDGCTAFSPEDRFEEIGQVRSALEKAGKRPRPFSLKKLLALSAVLICALCAGFAAGRLTDWFRPVPSVSFQEPLIEQAVRRQLGQMSGALTPEALAQVSGLYIYGSESYADPALFFQQRVEQHKEGPIRTLDDLALLPNLRELHIARQGYVDVSGVAGLAFAETVEFKHMRISGAQPVGQITRLKNAVLFDCGLSDVTALENCPWLESLDVGLNSIRSLAQIGNHPSVRRLGIMWLHMNSLQGISERLPKIQEVSLQHGSFQDLSALLSLQDLETVYVLADQKQAVTELFSGTNTKISVTEN